MAKKILQWILGKGFHLKAVSPPFMSREDVLSLNERKDFCAPLPNHNGPSPSPSERLGACDECLLTMNLQSFQMFSSWNFARKQNFQTSFPSSPNVSPAPLQKCVGDFCCRKNWRIWPGIFIFLEAFSGHFIPLKTKSGDQSYEKTWRLKNKIAKNPFCQEPSQFPTRLQNTMSNLYICCEVIIWAKFCHFRCYYLGQVGVIIWAKLFLAYNNSGFKRFLHTQLSFSVFLLCPIIWQLSKNSLFQKMGAKIGFFNFLCFKLIFGKFSFFRFAKTHIKIGVSADFCVFCFWKRKKGKKKNDNWNLWIWVFLVQKMAVSWRITSFQKK